MGLFSHPSTYTDYSDQQTFIWKCQKNCLYLHYKTERRCIYNVKTNNINVFIRSKKKYLEITKTICIFVSTK